MNDLKKYTKESFDNISLSDKKNLEIMNNILNNKKKFNYRLVIASVLLVFFITIGIVYAGDIKESIETLKMNVISKQNKDDIYSLVKFSSDATVNIKDVSSIELGKKYYIKDIEDELGIKFLNNYVIEKNELVSPSIKYENDKISFLSFSIDDLFNKDYNNDNFDLYNVSVVFKTQYYSNSSENLLSSGAPRWAEVDKYYLKNLNVEAYIVKYEINKKSGLKQWSLRFVYNNIYYMFEFKSKAKNPLLEIDKFVDTFEC